MLMLEVHVSLPLLRPVDSVWTNGQTSESGTWITTLFEFFTN